VVHEGVVEIERDSIDVSEVDCHVESPRTCVDPNRGAINRGRCSRGRLTGRRITCRRLPTCLNELGIFSDVATLTNQRPSLSSQRSQLHAPVRQQRSTRPSNTHYLPGKNIVSPMAKLKTTSL
jgi:hypothetical protein